MNIRRRETLAERTLQTVRQKQDRDKSAERKAKQNRRIRNNVLCAVLIAFGIIARLTVMGVEDHDRKAQATCTAPKGLDIEGLVCVEGEIVDSRTGEKTTPMPRRNHI